MSHVKDTILNYEIVTNSKLNHYEDLLSKFNQWISIKREIKITSLLEGKRIQFDIEDINTSGTIWGVLTTEPSHLINIKDCAFSIKSMSFILNGEKIDKLTLGIKILSTDKGELLENLIKDNIEIEIKEFIIDDKIHHFYIQLPNLAA